MRSNLFLRYCVCVCVCVCVDTSPTCNPVLFQGISFLRLRFYSPCDYCGMALVFFSVSCEHWHQYLFTYLLTPWFRVLLEKLTGLQLVKKFPAFLWNPKVRYRTQKRPPPVPVLGQPNPVHIPTLHLLEIHPNIIHPSTPRSPQWSLFLRFPHQDPIRPPLLTHTRHMPSASHSSRFYHPHNIG